VHSKREAHADVRSGELDCSSYLRLSASHVGFLNRLNIAQPESGFGLKLLKTGIIMLNASDQPASKEIFINQVVAPTTMKITTDTAISTLAETMTTSQPMVSQGSPARVPAVNAWSFTTSGKTLEKTL